MMTCDPLRRLVGIGWLLLGCSAGAADPDAHPRLLLDTRGLAAVREKIRSAPWSELWRQRLDNLDRAIAEPLRLPPRGGNWYHNYVCPEHGVRLREGRRTGEWTWEHHCPVGPHTLRGDPTTAALDFDGYSIMAVHEALAVQARDAGLAWALTGIERYAERAIAIVRAYAAAYLTYARHDNQGRPVREPGQGGRVASQPLSEATWLVPLLQGADFVWPRLDPADRQRFETGLVRVAIAETIRNPSRSPVVHNIQCHRNAAIGLAGFLLGDTQLVYEAISGPHGWHTNLLGGVLSDGVWFEGSWGYHFYTVRALLPLAEAARNSGLDLYREPLKRMFDAPLRVATPDGRLPAFNDSAEVALGEMANYYELALARYGDPAYAEVVRSGGSRSGPFALWYGVRDLPDTPALPRHGGSRNLADAGYAILQRGEGPDATWLCLKYGPHGGGHGHFDKNHLVLRSARRWILADSGTHLYGSRLHREWDKTSIAHSTLTIDERPQNPATGRCLAFGAADGIEYAMTDAGPIYPGVRFVRTVALLDSNLLWVADWVTADRARMLDVAVHVTGAWHDHQPGRPWSPPSAPGYRWLRDAILAEPAERVVSSVRGEGDRPIRLLAAAREPFSAVRAHGVGASTTDRVPVTIFRQTASEWHLTWALCWGDDAENARLDALAGENGVIRARLSAGGRSWELSADVPRMRVQGRSLE
ncbi:MAG: heparinase II/III family protein [Kiritimatiellae bacterium]|nr:heparinase II/III family protein [Kiritimatiellia bacterium]